MELAPREYRGLTGASNMIIIRISIFFNYCLGFGIPKDLHTTSEFWRVMLLLPLLFAAIHLLLFIFVFRNDTPTYVYMTTEDETKTMKLLKNLYTDERALIELKQL